MLIIEWNIGVSVSPHGGSHQLVNLYACSLSQMVMQEDTKIYPGSGKRMPYVQRGREVCIILHLSACTGANTSVVWSMGVLLRMGVVVRVCYLFPGPSFYSTKERPRVHA